MLLVKEEPTAFLVRKSPRHYYLYRAFKQESSAILLVKWDPLALLPVRSNLGAATCMEEPSALPLERSHRHGSAR